MCPRRHPDLVTHAVIADRCPRGVGTVKEIIAWERRIVTARITDAVVNGIVPIVIMIRVLSVPAAIVRFERVMRPANASISTRNNDVLPSESQGPHLRCVRIVDARLDRFRTLWVSRRFLDWARLRELVVDARIAFHSGHLRPSRQGFG